MITKTAERLVNIEQEITAVRSSFWNSKITYDQAREKVAELEEERERLWTQ